ncbi:MAG: hypothetical protein AAF734_02780 [Bacteroidota bacterium]
MKTFLLSVGLLLTSLCIKAQSEELLLQEWYVPFDSVYTKMSPLQKTYYDTLQTSIKESITADVERATINFKEGGTLVRTYSDGSTKTSNWTLHNQTLTVQEVGGDSFQYQVQSLSPIALVLSSSDHSYTLYYVAKP